MDRRRDWGWMGEFGNKGGSGTEGDWGLRDIMRS